MTPAIKNRIKDFILSNGMLCPGMKVLCAVSGGADSVFMTAVLKELEQELGISVYAAHFEHGIRGEESLRDRDFAASFCAEIGIPVKLGSGDVPAYARESALSVEEAARKLRYEFLEQARTETGCNVIATAHNMDDNAETVVFNLARGSGGRGLAGIPPVRGNIIRPVLCVSRKEIEAELAGIGTGYVTDSTNLTDDCTRNIIRHRVMPVLAEITEGAPAAVFRASCLVREDMEYLDSLAVRELESLLDTGGEMFFERSGNAGDGVHDSCNPTAGQVYKIPRGEELTIQAKKLISLPRPLSSRIVRMLWPASLTMEQVRSVLNICGGTERKCLNLPGGSAVSECGRLTLSVSGSENTHAESEKTGKRINGAAEDKKTSVGVTIFADTEIKPGGTFDIPAAGITVSCTALEYKKHPETGSSGGKQNAGDVCRGIPIIEISIRGKEIHGLLTTFILNCGEIYKPLVCGTVRSGDAIRIHGRGCTKQVRKLFSETGLTLEERRFVPVFRDQKGVLAVCIPGKRPVIAERVWVSGSH